MAEGGGERPLDVRAEGENTEAESDCQPLSLATSPESVKDNPEFQDIDLEDNNASTSKCLSGENQDAIPCSNHLCTDSFNNPNNSDAECSSECLSLIAGCTESDAVEAEQDRCPPLLPNALVQSESNSGGELSGGENHQGFPIEEEPVSQEGSGSGQSSPEGQGLRFGEGHSLLVSDIAHEDGVSEQEGAHCLPEEDQSRGLEAAGHADGEGGGEVSSRQESKDGVGTPRDGSNTVSAHAVELKPSIPGASQDGVAETEEDGINEPYEPECDLDSRGKNEHLSLSHNGDGAACSGLPKLLLSPSCTDIHVDLDQRTVHMDPGGSKRESSPTREALGQIQQGIESAISETLGFLDSNPPSASGSLTPSPTHTASSALHPEQLPTQSEVPKDDAKLSPVSVDRQSGETRLTVGGGDADTHGDVPEDELLSQLDAELDSPSTPAPVDVPNGVRRLSLSEIPEHKEIKMKSEELQKEVLALNEQITRLKSVHEAQDSVLLSTQQERDTYKKQVESSADEIYLAQIKALEVTIASQNKERKAGQEKLAAHDEAARQAVSKLQKELKTRVEQLTAMFEGCRKEKEDMVLKYAKAEQKNIEMETRMAKNDARVREIIKEREVFMGKFKVLKADQQRCRELFESRSVEVVTARRELEKQRELVGSLEVKNKWAHNKLKTELDAHKDTKGKLEDLTRKLRASKDEAEQIRRDCQAMVRSYQESDEIKSNTLDQELRQRESLLLQQEQERTDQMEVHQMVKRELETLKMKHKEMMEELKTWRDKVKCLDAERIIQEQNLDKYRETLQKQKETNSTINKRLIELESVERDIKDIQAENKDLEERNKELEQDCAELRHDMERCHSRESEHLGFTQKISDKNAILQTENNALHNKVKGLTAEQDRLSCKCEELENKLEKLRAALTEEQKLRAEETSQLSLKLEEKTKAVEQLTIQVEDEKNEIRTLKRKHAANSKDLMRQLQAAKRRMEALETKDGSPSMGSRTSSNGSLDNVTNHKADHKPSSNPTTPQEEAPPMVQVIEIDKQMLVEKIVRLQKAHARKNEKLEFLEDHIQQLFEEVQKKAKIIQNYALREEAGTMVPESADKHKASLAKKGGIMASLYTSQQQDGAMTLDLSLDISRKLQAVLEDTILKNITLKENLDTLGEEIARLSQENRRLQLQLQGEQT